MKKLFFIAIFAIFSLGVAAQQITAVHHYLPTLSEYQAQSYIGYDFFIPDHEVIFNSPNIIKQMRQENPGLLILVYVNKIEWHSPMYPDKPWSLNMVRELKKHPRWFMRDLSGRNLEFWPKTVLMNCRLDCPKEIINGKYYSYIEWFTERYIQDVIGAYKRAGIRLDGILDDELLKMISFIGNYGQNRNGIDCDGDLINDDRYELDRQWRLGNEYFLSEVRRVMGPEFIIIGNGGHGYYMKNCNGKEFEHFSEIFQNENDKLTEAWPENMNHAAGMEICIFNARTDNYGYKDNWLFTLCSAMLLDNVIFSHGQNMPYDEKYNLHLGKPLGPHYQVGNVVSRKFQNGTVNVNPVTKKAWVEK